MKRFLIILILFSTFCIQSAFASFIPHYSTSIKQTGYGVLKLPLKFTIYEKKDENSKIIEQFDINEAIKDPRFDETKYKNLFFLFNRQKNLAFVSVYFEEDDGWYEIMYNQIPLKTGWIKENKNNFYTWRDFFYKYGKKNGLYLFKDVNPQQKRLYIDTSIDSQIVAKFDKPKYIQPMLIRGNWMMIRIYEGNNYPKPGWFKWRTEEGKMLVFPNIK